MNLKSFSTKIHKKTEGIFCRLKKNEKTPFDHLFINIYNVIDPNTNDSFCIIGIGSFLNIGLQEPVNIHGIKIVSSNSLLPKTFNIEIDEKLIKSIENAEVQFLDNSKAFQLIIFYFDKFIFFFSGPVFRHFKN